MGFEAGDQIRSKYLVSRHPFTLEDMVRVLEDKYAGVPYKVTASEGFADEGLLRRERKLSLV